MFHPVISSQLLISDEGDPNDSIWTSFSGLCLFVHTHTHTQIIPSILVIISFTLKVKRGPLPAESFSEYMSMPNLVGCPENYLPFLKLEGGREGGSPSIKFVHIGVLVSLPLLPPTHSLECSNNCGECGSSGKKKFLLNTRWSICYHTWVPSPSQMGLI